MRLSLFRNVAQTNNIDEQRSTDPPKVCILKSPEETNNPVAWVIPPEVKTSALKRRSSNVQNPAKNNEELETDEKPSGLIEANPSQSLKSSAKKSARARSTLKAIVEEELMNMSDEDKIKMHNKNNISKTFVLSENSENKQPTDEQVPKVTVRKTSKNLPTTAVAAEKARSLKRNVKNYKDDVPGVVGDVKQSDSGTVMNDTSTRRAPKRKCTVKSAKSGTTKAKELEDSPETVTETVAKSSIQLTSNKNRKTQAKSSKTHCDNKKESEPTNTEDKDVVHKAETVKKTDDKKRGRKTNKSKSEGKLMETNGHEVICRVQKTTEKTLPIDSAPTRSKSAVKRKPQVATEDLEKTLPNDSAKTRSKSAVKRKPQVATEDLDQSGKNEKRAKKKHPSTEVVANNPVETKTKEVDNPKEKRENEQSCKFTALREKDVKSCFGLERVKEAEYVPGVAMHTLLHINNYVMTGKMLIKPRASITTSSTNTTYFVTQGVATVTVMSTKMVISSQDERNTFFIPKGADFSIVNESRDVLKLLFTKFKD